MAPILMQWRVPGSRNSLSTGHPPLLGRLPLNQRPSQWLIWKAPRYNAPRDLELRAVPTPG
jgi:hypothetical protein